MERCAQVLVQKTIDTDRYIPTILDVRESTSERTPRIKAQKV